MCASFEQSRTLETSGLQKRNRRSRPARTKPANVFVGMAILPTAALGDGQSECLWPNRKAVTPIRGGSQHNFMGLRTSARPVGFQSPVGQSRCQLVAETEVDDTEVDRTLREGEVVDSSPVTDELAGPTLESNPLGAGVRIDLYTNANRQPRYYGSETTDRDGSVDFRNLFVYSTNVWYRCELRTHQGSCEAYQYSVRRRGVGHYEIVNGFR